MEKLIARPAGDVAVWCAERGVTEDALELVAEAYGRDRMSAAAAVEAFRLGVDSTESRRVRGEPTEIYKGPRYTIQFVVVDSLDGTLMGPLVVDCEDADRLARFLNGGDWPGP